MSNREERHPAGNGHLDPDQRQSARNARAARRKAARGSDPNASTDPVDPGHWANERE